MTDRITIGRDELADLVRGAAKAGTQDALRELGIRMDDPANADEWRETFAFMRFLRRARDTMGRSIANTIIVLLVTGVGGMLWYGFRVKVAP